MAQALRLFTGDDRKQSIDPAGGEPAAFWTLADLYQHYAREVYYQQKRASPLTTKQVQETLAVWSALLNSPTISAINNRTCAQFVNHVSRLPARRGRRPDGVSYESWIWSLVEEDHDERIAVATVVKHCRTLQPLLNMTGPIDRRNPNGLNLVERSAWFDPPRLDSEQSLDAFTLGEIAAWLAACSAARSPRAEDTGAPPARWWKALVLWLFNTGMRIGTAMQLRWSWIDGHVATIPPSGMKRRKGQMLYANSQAMAAIRDIRVPGRDLVFAFPNWPRSQNWLQRIREQLLAAAGIPEQHRWGFHGLRGACAMTLTEATGDVSLSQLQLGHTKMATTITHYQRVKAAGPTLERLPQPGGFIQRDLFAE